MPNRLAFVAAGAFALAAAPLPGALRSQQPASLGHWPDRTIFVIEQRGSVTEGSINKLPGIAAA